MKKLTKRPRGRPPIGPRRTTNAERNAKWRAKQKQRIQAIDSFEVRLKALEDKVELLSVTPTG